MTLLEKQELVNSYGSWYHEFDFGEGVKCTPLTSHPDIWNNIENLMSELDFRGKTVLDIGCWDGYWSFQAEKRGAKSVLATDYVSQRWGDNKGFEIAKRLLGSKVEYNGNLSVYEIGTLKMHFDIVLYFGVYYHLQCMEYGFAQLRKVVKENGILLTEGAVINNLDESYMEFYYGEDDGSSPLRKDRSNWSCPTRRCLKDSLSACYFEVEDERFPYEDHFKYARSLTISRAVKRRDDHHAYEAPLGLGKYDLRFTP